MSRICEYEVKYIEKKETGGNLVRRTIVVVGIYFYKVRLPIVIMKMDIYLL